ncbi:unnamed protein product, partial [Citrullus colocynthis]
MGCPSKLRTLGFLSNEKEMSQPPHATSRLRSTSAAASLQLSPPVRAPLFLPAAGRVSSATGRRRFSVDSPDTCFFW